MTADDRRALAAGLPADLLLVLIRARRMWWETNGGDTASPEVPLSWELPDGWWLDGDLAAAVTHPAAVVWDAVFVGTVRRRLRR